MPSVAMPSKKPLLETKATIPSSPIRAEADPEALGRLAPSDVALITAPTDMSMRATIELRQASGHPVALVEDGRLVGVCGDEEIYRGILRQTGLAEAPADVPAPAASSAPDPDEAARRAPSDQAAGRGDGRGDG